MISLICLGLIASVPNLVYVPWPRLYIDLAWWQVALICLPVAALLLGVAIALLTGLSRNNPAWERPVKRYFGLVALTVLALNLVILF